MCVTLCKEGKHDLICKCSPVSSGVRHVKLTCSKRQHACTEGAQMQADMHR
jgi:hypothetical protein